MKIILAAILTIVMSGFVLAQTTATTKTTDTAKPIVLTEAEQKLWGELYAAQLGMGLCANLRDNEDCKKSNYEDQYRQALVKAIGYPNLILFIVSDVAKSYEGNKVNARSAPQVSQIADEQNVQLMRIIVIQNQKIIELLEQIAKKK